MGYCSMLKINDILRASGVTRWHIVRTVKPQSLAEHTFDVVMIARAIAKLAGYDDSEIVKAALLHDLDEIVNGDFPTPSKQRALDKGWDLNELYRNITGREIGDDESLIIHLADKMADLYWLWLHALGPHANRVYEIMADRFNEHVRSESIPDNIREATLDVQVQMLSEDFTI